MSGPSEAPYEAQIPWYRLGDVEGANVVRASYTAFEAQSYYLHSMLISVTTDLGVVERVGQLLA